MSEVRTVSAPVRRVTLFEDRGEITRLVRVELPAGRSILRVEDLGPLMADAQLTAQLETPVDGVDVEDVRMERRLQGDHAPADRRADALAAQDASERALTEAERAQARARQRRDAALNLLQSYANQASRALWTPAGASGWREGLTRLEGALEAAEKAVAVAEAARDKAAEEHRKRAALVRDAEDRPLRLRAGLTVRVAAERAAAVTVQITAIVPCALWRPAHEARLGPDGTLTWTTFATVWQRTGEDWEDVELVLSTDRPGAGAVLPDLSPDELRLQGKVSRKRVVLSHRQQSARRGDDAAVPGVYDGGEARRFPVADPVHIPSDGRPYRVSTGGFDTPATLRLVARPEVSPHVFWLADARNESSTPLLAGPVTLVRDGGYVGVGQIAYVGPGETFDLAFGSDDRWRLRARRTRELEERRLGRDRLHFVTHVDLRYAGAGQGAVDVMLRLPKSEIDQLKVLPSKDWCSGGPPEPDEDGLVRVPVRLAPGEREEVTLGFYFETSGEVVLPDPW